MTFLRFDEYSSPLFRRLEHNSSNRHLLNINMKFTLQEDPFLTLTDADSE